MKLKTHKRNILILLTVVLGSAIGFVVVYGAGCGFLLAALFGGETEFGVLAAVLIVIGASILLGGPHNKLREKLRLPHWALISMTCILPVGYSVWFRADHLYKAEHGGYSGFMGGLGKGIDDLLSLCCIFSAVGFIISRIVVVCIINHIKKS